MRRHIQLLLDACYSSRPSVTVRLTSDGNRHIASLTSLHANYHIHTTCSRGPHPLVISSLLSGNKKAQLSLTNPRDAKACQKLLQFEVLTTLSLTILAYLHAFSCCWVRNLRNHEKFTENSNLWSSRSSKVIDLGANRKPYVTCY